MVCVTQNPLFPLFLLFRYTFTDMTPDEMPPTEAQKVATPPAVSQSTEVDVEENKDIAAFSYLWVMSVIVYFLKKDSPFVRFHSTQAMILFAASIVIWMIPIGIVAKALELVILAGMVMGFLNAVQGQRRDVPFVGPLSRREKGFRETWRAMSAAIVRMYERVKHMLHGIKKKDNKPPTSPSSPTPTPTPSPSPIPPQPEREYL